MSDLNLPQRVISVATLPKSGFHLELEADEGARDAIAAHAGVEEISELEADITLFRWRKDGVRIAGRLIATVRQPCVVTLEPLVQEIGEDLKLLFVPEGSKLTRPEEVQDGELVLDPFGEDIPATFTGGQINVWEPLIEQFILAVDLWPRAPGAELPAGQEDQTAAENEAGSPFAVLKNLQNDD